MPAVVRAEVAASLGKSINAGAESTQLWYGFIGGPKNEETGIKIVLTVLQTNIHYYTDLNSRDCSFEQNQITVAF